MLTRYKKYIFCVAALEHLIKRVELLRLRQLRDISGVDKESRRGGHRIDAIERNLERLRHIFVCLFAEADVTVANLEKAKVRSRRQRASCLRDFSKGSRRQHPAAYGPKQAGPGPRHALEKAAAINSVVFVIVRNVVWHNLAPKLVLVIFVSPVPTDSARFYSPKSSSSERAAALFRNSFFAVAPFRRLSLQKRRAQASAHSAAFELAKSGQSICRCAASAARARELISCKN